MSICKAMTGRGKPCSREVIGIGKGYADQTLDFGNYCGIHIWGSQAVPITESLAPLAIEAGSEVGLGAGATVSAPVLTFRHIPTTAAREALTICRKFYPWRAA